MTWRVCGLFSGIGGFELGFEKAGFEAAMLCENDRAAQAVLRRRFPGVRISEDVRLLNKLPKCDVVTAGWPCQDLSQAGQMAGIAGHRSSLVGEVFRLIDASKPRPPFVLLENVAFALHLHGGNAIRYVCSELEKRNYRWAYRVLNTREFGLPQRRRRLFILASLDLDPFQILYDPCVTEPDSVECSTSHLGFYWTEGNRGAGWTPNAIPPLKGGSGLSIPSPPAVWVRLDREFISPGLEDSEALQGFPRGWTRAAGECTGRDAVRWRLIGNAVSVPVACWIAKRIIKHSHKMSAPTSELATVRDRWLNFGWGSPGKLRLSCNLPSEGPVKQKPKGISAAIRNPTPLSLRAANGFLTRFLQSPLRKDPEFVADLTRYCQLTRATS